MEKNYIKSFAKERKFDNWWSIIALSINLEELNKLPKDKYWNIKIDVCKKRESDQYGNTHYVVENTFVSKVKEQVNDDVSNDVDEWLPF